MSEELPSREQAVQILQETKCPPQVISHCVAVADLAVEIAQKLQSRGYRINIQLVEAGAMLHDLGRSRTHTVDHAVVGAQIAQSLGLSQSIVNIVKRHVGAGITDADAQRLGWPRDVYTPQTLEEKVVTYADKRIALLERVPIERELEQLRADGMAEAAERVRKLHEEIISMIGDTP